MSSEIVVNGKGWGIIALLVAVASCAYSVIQVRRLEAELASRPPIAVVDLTQVTEGTNAEVTVEVINERLTRVQAVSQKLAAAGYVVLERGNVEAYPVAIEVRP